MRDRKSFVDNPEVSKVWNILYRCTTGVPGTILLAATLVGPLLIPVYISWRMRHYKIDFSVEQRGYETLEKETLKINDQYYPCARCHSSQLLDEKHH